MRQADEVLTIQAGQMRAVIVGIESYQTTTAAGLRGVADESVAYARALRKLGVPAANIQLFLSLASDDPGAPERRSDSITNALRAGGFPAFLSANRDVICDHLNALAGIKDLRLLWVFWTGHGYRDGEGGARLLFANANNQAQRNLELTSMLASLASRRYSTLQVQVVVIDACALASHRSFPGEKFDGGEAKPLNHQFVLFAASPGQEASHRPGKGALAAALVHLLEERAEALECRGSRLGLPDLRQLSEAVIAEVKELTGGKQIPYTEISNWGPKFNLGVFPVRDALPRIEWTAARRRELTHALVPLASLGDHLRCALIAKDLRVAPDRLRDDIDSVVNDFAVHQAVDDLLGAIEAHLAADAGDSLEEARQLIGEIRESRVPLRQGRRRAVEALKQLDNPLPAPTLSRLALACLCVQDRLGLRGTAEGLLDTLSALPFQLGKSFPRPALEFLERLAREVEPRDHTVADALRGVIADAAELVGKTYTELRALEPTAEPGSLREPAAHPVLVVDYRPHFDPLGGYYEDLHLWREGSSWVWSRWASSTRAVDDSLLQPEFFRRLSDEVSPQTSDGELLAIEFVLPSSLRGVAFDQWQSEVSPSLDVTLGIFHPVAVRCRDRHQNWARCWKDAWHLLRDTWFAPGSVPWVEVAKAEHKLSRPNALLTALAERRGRACVIMTVAPEDFSSRTVHAALVDAIIRAGVPLAVWLRDRPGVAANVARKVLRKRLARCRTLDELPEQIRRFRCEADGPAGQLSRQVTLLWDDPARLPPSRPRPGPPEYDGGGQLDRR